MNELIKLLSSDECPDDAPTKDLGWHPVAKLSLPSGKLWVGDPGFSWAELRGDDGVRIDLAAGDYEVSAQVMEFGPANLITRLRVCRSGVAAPSLGAEVDTAGTDSGAIGVCDARELWRAFEDRYGEDEDEPVMFLESFDYNPCGLLQPNGKAGAALVYVATGSDGGGPVFELVANGQRVGVELPFGGDEEDEEDEE